MICPNSAKSGIKPLSQLQHPREVIRQFTPNWFAATMGTGVLALALAQLPVAIPGLHAVAEGLWLFNILLFTLFTFAYAARWVLFFDEARRIFGHSTVSMFFGTIPMGLATIINGFLLFGLPRWGEGVIHLADAHAQLVVLTTSYVLWAFSLPVAFSILTILLLRMALHKLPHENMAASSWLALGPIGTGALGMLLLGSDAPAIFAANGLRGIGEIAAGLGLIAGITLWGFGLWWMLMALLITARYLRDGIPFNLGWWGFTFPLGVYSLATLKLASTLNLGFFSVVGCVLVTLLAVMWLIVGKRTVQGAWRGELFVSPCIAGLKK